VDLWVQSRVTGAKVFDIQKIAWYQDLDVGESYDKFASGFSPQVRDYWSDLKAGIFLATFTYHKERDDDEDARIATQKEFDIGKVNWAGSISG
jgi:hypothetical protein